MDPKTHAYPYFYTPYEVLITMHPCNTCAGCVGFASNKTDNYYIVLVAICGAQNGPLTPLGLDELTSIQYREKCPAKVTVTTSASRGSPGCNAGMRDISEVQRSEFFCLFCFVPIPSIVFVVLSQFPPFHNSDQPLGHRGHSSPLPATVRAFKICLDREKSSETVFFPRRLVSNCAYTRSALPQVNFPAGEKGPLGGPRTRGIGLTSSEVEALDRRGHR